MGAACWARMILRAVFFVRFDCDRCQNCGRCVYHGAPCMGGFDR